jgi:tetratricopeptide (TPR) repeat protein
MFEFGRELRRIFGAARAFAPSRDGLTGGDATLLELLDADMLRTEAKGADVAAGRIGARDRAHRLLEAATVWRELARRTGDPVALRKAAATAARAAEACGPSQRRQGWARARLEQARCAILGSELFGDEGLEAAAESAAGEAQKTGGAAGALAQATLATIQGRRTIVAGSVTEVRLAARGFNACIAALEAGGRREPPLKLAAAEARMARADILAHAGLRLKDENLMRAAIGDLAAAAELLDPAYEPLTLSRAMLARAAAKSALGELTGDLAAIAGAVSDLAAALDTLGRDHSPLDWARGQAALAQALSQLGEATENQSAYERAIAAYDRAALALRASPQLLLRAQVTTGRGLALVRSAELTGDLTGLDAAEAAFKAELAAGPHKRTPVAWAMLQVQLGQLYAARVLITGRDRGERAAAALAFSSALDVFAEEGLRSFTVIAADGLERLSSTRVN